jgi:hypothetical protein
MQKNALYNLEDITSISEAIILTKQASNMWLSTAHIQMGQRSMIECPAF